MFREEYILVKGSLLLNKVAVLHTLSPKKTEKRHMRDGFRIITGDIFPHMDGKKSD